MVPATGFHLMPGAGAAPPPLPGASLAGINPMVQRLMSNPGIHSVDAIEAEQRRSASPPGQEQQHVSHTDIVPTLFLLIACIPCAGPGPAQDEEHVGPGAGPEEEAPHRQQQPPGQQQRPHLRPGADTRHPRRLRQAAQPPGVLPARGQVATNIHVILNIYKYYLSRSPSPPAVTNGVSPPAGQLTPLTQGQLVEAINFLLEHDQDFVTKIHQAYVMSLTRRLTAK